MDIEIFVGQFELLPVIKFKKMYFSNFKNEFSFK